MLRTIKYLPRIQKVLSLSRAQRGVKNNDQLTKQKEQTTSIERAKSSRCACWECFIKRIKAQMFWHLQFVDPDPTFSLDIYIIGSRNWLGVRVAVAVLAHFSSTGIQDTQASDDSIHLCNKQSISFSEHMIFAGFSTNEGEYLHLARSYWHKGSIFQFPSKFRLNF